MFHNKIFFFFLHLRADLWRQQEIIWKGNKTFNFRLTEALLADSRTIFSGGAGLFSILFHQQTRHNFLSPFFCFFQLFASGNELPAICMSWGRTRLSCQGVDLYIIYPGYPEGRHGACWDRHWYSCCLSFPICNVGLKLQRANNCLLWLLRGYLIRLCSALKMKNCASANYYYYTDKS